jgi:predicted nucleic acid-binding protein
MIVVDTNIVAYAFIEGDFSKQARDFFNGSKDWIVPPIFEHGATNILASYGRFKGFSIKACAEILRDMLRFVGGRRIVPVDHEEVLAFAIRNDIASYDAEFLWLARNRDSICLTEDRALLKKFPTLAKSLRAHRAS